MQFCWSLKKITRAYLFQIALEIMWLPIRRPPVELQQTLLTLSILGKPKCLRSVAVAVYTWLILGSKYITFIDFLHNWFRFHLMYPFRVWILWIYSLSGFIIYHLFWNVINLWWGKSLLIVYAHDHVVREPERIFRKCTFALDWMMAVAVQQKKSKSKSHQTSSYFFSVVVFVWRWTRTEFAKSFCSR